MGGYRAELGATDCCCRHRKQQYVVWGPPGTGKTKTIVEAVLQTLAEHANAHVLVTAPSHSATDTIVTRLSRHLPPSSLLRLNHHTRSFAETPSPLLPWTFIDPDTNTYFSIPPVSDILSRRVVACTCRDASLLVDVGAANSALEQVWREHHAWLRKTYPHIHKGEPPPWIPHWTHAFVDEAGQALEPEVVIPMTVVAAPKSTGRNLPSQFILCGDYRQLGPSIRSDLANSKGLGVSLLERIMATSLYKDHPTARGRTGSEGQSTVEALQNVVPPFQNLVRNYRSHPVILMEPSRIFYSDTLIPCANPNDTLSLLKWEGLPNPQLPLVFYGVRGEDEAMDVNDSWWNEAEVAAVVECVESLLLVSADERKGSAKGKQTGKVHPEHFGVIAPFREQVRRIRQVLRSKKLAGVNVGTVEDYQGMERRIVVLSCVRVREKYANEDKKRGVGVVLPGTWDGRRLNVALTRAKELLVVIGDPHMWKRDKHWSDLLQFALRNNLYRGAPLPFHFSAGGFASPELSALERQWRASQTFQAAPSLGSAVMQKGWHAKEMTLTPEHE
ncbi:P-loop containing nucleoside triphosphate hydrolase protein [Gonapodya prolifera JEL478]|uniref:p-loop containing nucleoside triphosphate hydrolase protein n=1 Tax=Gonapodya prolifera (strain JEL478) TaxID=1344416 RepID=A0A139ATE7_GONPJ|nr:P-loop containing nucleoside triphosphate hydrolase protein [Gonapodya prolifera JEL478]|eukprot:KXS20010.1 P-loop containing nucleoside triphosphate hydrolase protein [Gonapodya prolifera JEL478]